MERRLVDLGPIKLRTDSVRPVLDAEIPGVAASPFRDRVKEHDVLAQFIARDEMIGRWFRFEKGRITSGAGVRKDADVTVAFKTARLGADLLTPPINWLDQINAQKEFALTVEGDDGLANWFAQTVMMSQSVGLEFGTRCRTARCAIATWPMAGRCSSTSRTARSSARRRSSSTRPIRSPGPSRRAA